MKKRSVAIVGSMLALGILLSGCTAAEPEVTSRSFAKIAKEQFKLEASEVQIKIAGDTTCLVLRKGGDFSAVELELSRNNQLVGLDLRQIEDFAILAHEAICPVAPIPTGEAPAPVEPESEK